MRGFVGVWRPLTCGNRPVPISVSRINNSGISTLVWLADFFDFGSSSQTVERFLHLVIVNSWLCVIEFFLQETLCDSSEF